MIFLQVRTLKCQVLPEGQAAQSHDMYGNPTMGGAHHQTSGNKRRMYILLFVAGIQPLLMWWLSFHLISVPAPKVVL